MRAFKMTLFCAAILTAAPATADDAPPDPAAAYAAIFEGAETLGSGVVDAYRKGDDVILSIPAEVFGRLLFWSAQVTRYPAEAIATGGAVVGSAVVQLERRGGRVLMLNRAPGYAKAPGPSSRHSPGEADVKITPIAAAVDAAANPPVAAAFPVLGVSPDGDVAISVAAAFSADFDSLSARAQVATAGVVPQAVDPSRSYISSVKVFEANFAIRSQLTFLGVAASAPLLGLQPRTIEIGHSLALLPETPMRGRRFDRRVGFFETSFTEYEAADGEATRDAGFILRHRLEKTDPAAAVSDPVKPVTVHIGRGVPDRWRPYIREGVELWNPVFEAAGFSNALVVRDAPTEEEDPDWSPEDARLSVIRWVAQPYGNAMGANVHDPRSGEILSLDVFVWAEVIDLFEAYYFAAAAGRDPEIGALPLSVGKRGELLRYVIAHEIGHAIGLRHNHLASTAYSVAQLRDPALADRHGPNASIMAYGRFNQVARPGDGVSRFVPVIGPADYFSIAWGYGDHGDDPAAEAEALERLAAGASRDERLRWAAGEMPAEEKWRLDPRVLKENVGRERIEATRLGVANGLLALSRLDAATKGDDALFKAVYDVALPHLTGFLDSAALSVGGVLIAADGGPSTHPTAEEQAAAVAYVLGDGARSLDAFAAPGLLSRVYPIGGAKAVADAQAKLVAGLLSGDVFARIEAASQAPGGYTLDAFADDATNAVWGDLTDASAGRRAMHRAYAASVVKALTPDPAATTTRAALAAAGYSAPFAGLATATGRDTDFAAWARAALAQRLDEAATAGPEASRAHWAEMAARIRATPGFGG